jgi:hypothetical protein
LWSFSLVAMAEATSSSSGLTLRAGASMVDISPTKLPVLINGGFLQDVASKVNDQLYARCIVLDDGLCRLAIVVVDSCMLPRELLDRAKVLARAKTGLRTSHILISATHTHSAPAAMGALGCPADSEYAERIPQQIAEAIAQAASGLVPARLGWTVIADERHTFCRRWIRRPDRMSIDPFGNKTVRANMHPGHLNPDAIAPSGPVDPALTVLSIQTMDQRPLAVLANYSQHYYGSSPVSADYYGHFAAALARRLDVKPGNPPFVGIMSQGTSGDQMWMDYSRARNQIGLEQYADEVAEVAARGYKSITTYYNQVPLDMVESTLTLQRRAPDEQRVRWARSIISQLGDRIPRNLSEVYAKEALYLHQEPQRELRIQAIRIGELGITAIPNEVFALTGLKIKARSPLPLTMNIALANGSEGYIPPPEQHALGGYTTWPARTAALEVQAEPQIVATVLGLLEKVSRRPRRGAMSKLTPYAEHVAASRPLAYWRLEEMEGTRAQDATGHGNIARYENGFALYLPGVDLPGFTIGRSRNHAPHLAGGRLLGELVLPAESNSIEFWFWNGMPNDARPVTAYLCARAVGEEPCEVLGLSGTRGPVAPGRLFLSLERGRMASAGTYEIKPSTWHHVAVTRSGRLVNVYLDGNPRAELTADSGVGTRPGITRIFVGGKQDPESTLEGKIDDVALYDRPLSSVEISEHLHAASDPR